MNRRRQSGLSLIELMIGLAILGMLLALGVPMFTTWIQNTQIRTAADGFLNGVQSARNEAIRRNAAVQVKMVGSSGWKIHLKGDDPEADPPLVERSEKEGSLNAVATITPAAAHTVTFSALGRVVANEDGTSSITRIDIDNPTLPTAESRELRITITTGGAVKLCDPQVLPADPRSC